MTSIKAHETVMEKKTFKAEKECLSRGRKDLKIHQAQGKLKIKAAINAYICTYRDRLPTAVFLGFPCGSAGKESACNVRDLVSIPGLGRSPGEGNGYPFQCSGLKNSMDCMGLQKVGHD